MSVEATATTALSASTDARPPSTEAAAVASNDDTRFYYESPVEKAALVTFLAVIDVVGTYFNGVLLYLALNKAAGLRLHSNVLAMIGMLAGMDMSVCVVAIPYTMVTTYWDIQDRGWCKLVRTVRMCAINGSSLMVVAVAIERFIAICHPTMSLSLRSVKKLAVACLSVAFGVSLGSLLAYDVYEIPSDAGTYVQHKCVLGKEDPKGFAYKKFLIAFYLGAVLIQVLLYALVFRRILARPLKVGAASAAAHDTSAKEYLAMARQQKARRQRALQHKSAYLFSAVTFIYLMSWLVYILEVLGVPITRLPLHRIPHHFYFLQNISNFTVYLLFNPRLRHAIIRAASCGLFGKPTTSSRVLAWEDSNNSYLGGGPSSVKAGPASAYWVRRVRSTGVVGRGPLSDPTAKAPAAVASPRAGLSR